MDITLSSYQGENTHGVVAINVEGPERELH